MSEDVFKVTPISLRDEFNSIKDSYDCVIKNKDAINAFQLLFHNLIPDPKPLFNIILDSKDPRLMYETALNIDDAPVEALYREVLNSKNTFFIALFEEIL